MEREKHIRLGLALLTVALVGLAIYLPRAYREDSLEKFYVSGTYRSDLLNKEVSPDALRVAAGRDEVRSVVGGHVKVEGLERSPFLVKVTTSTPEQGQVELAQQRAIKLLSSKLKEAALTEISASLQYIDEFKREAAKLRKRRPADTSGSSSAPLSARLSEKEAGRILLLQEEIRQLEAFFQGAELAKPIRMKLERRTLAEAEERLRNAQRELARLATLFHPGNQAVRAQQDYKEKVRGELRSLEEHLAGVYLKTLRLELETLESKALSMVQENIAVDESLKAGAAEEASPDSEEWIQERARVLQERADAITLASSLKLEGELEFGENGGRSSSLALACWLAALASFLGLLFRPARNVTSAKASEPRRPRRESVLPSPQGLSKMDLPRLPVEPQLALPLDHFEAFFSHIFEEITRALGRTPRRILVLGDHAVESRLAFSIRLANNLGREFGSVRLIDFDLQEKSLSERLGRQSLPGVGDLLMRGGPVEEFFSSIAGTSIQFAPAGSFQVIEHEVDPGSVKGIFGTGEVITIIDASSASPLHLVVRQVDAVLYATRDVGFADKSAREQQVLVAFRDAGLPIWGVSVNQSQFYPLL